jgi:hypothetical protein
MSDKPSPNSKLVLAMLCVLLATGLLRWRGVLRGAEGSLDFTMVYASARQWAFGYDPYPFEPLYDVYVEQGGVKEGKPSRPRDPMWFASLYPPMTYAVLSPLGLMDWDGARLGWLCVNILATIAVGVWLVKHRPPVPAPGSGAVVPCFVLAGFLASAPLHTTLAFGQLGLVTLALMLLAISLVLRDTSHTKGKAILAGIALALAGALKPQLLAPVALALLVTTAWRAVLLGMGVGVVITAIAALRIEPTWVENWLLNLREFAGKGFADPSADNPVAYQMIHLSPLLHRLMPGIPGAAKALAVLLPMAALLLAMIGHWKRTIARGDAEARIVQTSCFHPSYFSGPPGLRASSLQLLSVACVVTLLITYHRTYDAVMLVVPVVWAWHRLHIRRSDVAGWCVVALLVLLALPTPQLLASREVSGYLPTALIENPLWYVVVLMQHNWMLLALLCILLGSGPRRSSDV